MQKVTQQAILTGLKNCNKGKCFFCGKPAIGFKHSDALGLNYWFCPVHSVEREYDLRNRFYHPKFFYKFERACADLCEYSKSIDFDFKDLELEMFKEVEWDVRKAIGKIEG